MMITLTARDFKRLSAPCQQELLALLTLNDVESQADEDHASLAEEEGARPVAGRGVKSRKPVPPVSDSNRKKEILEISVEQARQLVANVNDSSKKTLKIFAERQLVPLKSLVGDNANYGNYAKLKRSLVGAVNRRLRTVTGNRDAVLFTSDATKSSIKIRPKSAAALRQALDVDEPMPSFEFYDQNGVKIDGGLPEAWAFTNQVEVAWRDIKSRPEVGYAGLSVPQIVGHLLKRGYRLVCSKVTNEPGRLGRFEYQSESGVTDVLSRMGRDGFVNLGDQEGVTPKKILLAHPSQPGVFGQVLLNDHDQSKMRGQLDESDRQLLDS